MNDDFVSVVAAILVVAVLLIRGVTSGFSSPSPSLETVMDSPMPSPPVIVSDVAIVVTTAVMLVLTESVKPTNLRLGFVSWNLVMFYVVCFSSTILTV